MSFILSSNVTPVILSPGASMLLINRVFTLLSAKVYQTEITIAVGLLCLYLFLYMSWSKYRKSIAHSRLKQQERCQPAVGYPHRDRILGLDLLWKLTKALQNHTFLETTRELLQQEYNTIEYLVLGNKAIVTIEPENVKTILSSKFQEFGLGNPRKRSLKPLFGDGIFNVDGMMWNHSRTFLRPHITRQRDEVLDIFEKHVQNLIKSLPMDGRTFDFQDSISCLMMDIATEVFLGESTDVLSSASPNLSTTAGCVFAQAFEYAQLAVSGINQLSLYEIFSKQFGDRKLKKSLQIIDCFMDRVIQKAQQSLRNVNSEDVDGEATFLEHLVKDTQEFQRIKHDILNLLLAGKDTVTALLSNTWFVLAKRPDIYAKLRAEIAMLNGERPSGQQLKDLKYLRYVLNETFRLYPPVPLNQRTAEVDTCLPLGGGPDRKLPLFVAKGTSVGYSLYAMHRRKDIFGEDAEEFRPERWGENLRPGWAYLPFNGGPRACLGQQYALKKVSYVIVRLVQQFERVESRDPLQWQERLSLTCFSRNGVKIGLVPAREKL